METVNNESKVSWAKACDVAKMKFSVTLDDNLQSITLPSCISCTNLHCKTHCEEIDEYTMEVLETLKCASN